MTATIVSTDLPEIMADSVRYTEIPVRDVVPGHCVRQVRMGRERHISVTKTRICGDYVVLSYMHQGTHGELNIRADQVVEVVAN